MKSDKTDREKVYCKDCKHEKYGIFELKSISETIKADGEKITSADSMECPEFNRGNSCKHYKRKWYKIWIK